MGLKRYKYVTQVDIQVSDILIVWPVVVVKSWDLCMIQSS